MLKQPGADVVEALHHEIDAQWDSWLTQAQQHGRWWAQCSVQCPHTDPLRWLQQQISTSRIFWTNRERDHITAGIGQADLLFHPDATQLLKSLKETQSALQQQQSNTRYYGGMRFSWDTTPAPCWAPFGAGRFVLPQFELRQQTHHTTLLCNVLLHSNTHAEEQRKQIHLSLETLRFQTEHLPTLPHTPIHTLSRTEQPDHHSWCQQVQHALTHFADGSLQKIVLARQIEISLQNTPNPCQLLENLYDHNPDTFAFVFQLSPSLAFLGVTPEQLFKRERDQLKSEALAGTRSRHPDQYTDERLGSRLRKNEKEVHEHLVVLDVLRNHFSTLCEHHHIQDALALKKLTHVQHLNSQIYGKISPQFDDADILAQLHPTPAVGGRPGREAVALIEQMEPFDRGWYAAPVGWFGANDAEFAVAIRAGLLSDNTLRLYSGAGLVAGSNPEYEWRELERKLGPFTSLFAN